MSDSCETVRVVSEKSDDNPAGYIVINKEDFDAEKHELFVDPGEAAASGNASLTVAQLKEALTAKGIAFDEGMKKAELLALLDAGSTN